MDRRSPSLADHVAHAKPSAHAALRVWTLHLVSLAVPLYTLAFLASGPHAGYRALPWLLVIPVVWLLDRYGGRAHHKPDEEAPAWPFDAILLTLSSLQLANVTLAARMVAASGARSWDLPVAVLLVGVNSGYSAIVVAHELVHRKERPLLLLGRALLCTVFYDHFATEHVRGHHARVGTEQDPATARFGETFGAFWRRTVRGQLASAWRLECKRLGDEAMPFWDRRLASNTVFRGLLFEAALAAAVTLALGPVALLFLVGQAYVAVGLLEAVNYFEHYGLRRSGKKVRPVDSWDSDSRFTLFALVGLSRHADHHAYASRPFQSLRTWDESPKLPAGYIVTALMVIFDNARLRRLLERELQRRHLGPFALESDARTSA